MGLNRCPECASAAAPSAKFCSECGTVLQTRCPKCAAAVASSAKFCGECGASLPTGGGRPSTALETSPALARLRSDPDAADETRLLTVLFADMSGSVAATYGLDPEAAVRRVNEVLARMAEMITKNGGNVNRFLGDGVLAFFGTPQAHEDDAMRAITAALQIRDALRPLSVSITAGINTGEVYLGRIGSAAHGEFSAMGSVVNLASRFQSAAEPGRLLVGEDTYRLARGAFEFTPLSLTLKGVPQSINAYAVVRPLPRPDRARGIEGLRAELTGRDDELAQLERALVETRIGKGQIVTVVAGAGVGKSRLIAEFRRRNAHDTARDEPQPIWLEGRCLESTIATSYWPFLDILRSYFAFVREEQPQAREARLAARLEALNVRGLLPSEQLQDILPLFMNLLLPGGRTHHAGPLRNASPQQIKNQTLMAVGNFFRSLAREQPVVIVLDDLHWADALSLDLVALLMSGISDVPLLLLCAYRPDSHHKSRHLTAIAEQEAAGHSTLLELRELSAEESRRLLCSLLATDAPPPEVEDVILARAQGNPFFVEEVLRSLIDAREVYRDDGHWRVRSSGRAIRVPASIQSIILSRIDRLDDRLKEVLQAAATIGRLFARDLLAALVGSEADLERALGALEQQDLIYLDRVVPEEEYSFKHVFTRDIVYNSLLQDRREVLHLSVAEAIEALYAGQLDERVEQLAHHYERTDVHSRAIDYLVRAGERSRLAYLNEEAVEYFQRALDRLSSVSSEPERGRWCRETRANVAESLGDVLELAGRHAEAEERYGEAIAVAIDDDVAGDSVRRARLLRKIGSSRRVQRRVPAATQAFDEALAALGAEPAGAAPEWWQERVEIESARLYLLYFNAPAHEFMAAVEGARPLIETRGTSQQRGWFLHQLALLHIRGGLFCVSAETVELSRRSLEAMQERGSIWQIAESQFALGFVQLWAGQLDEAEKQLRESLALAERIGEITVESRCLTYLALLYRKRGDVEETRSWAFRAREVAETSAMSEYIAAADAHRAWVAWRDGDHHEAERLGRKSSALWSELGGPYRALAWMPAWPLLGIALAGERTAEALEHARFLLDSATQPAPEPLMQALQAALSANDDGSAQKAREQLEQAGELARSWGYL
ncbi:MAG: AAA family ATPase [Longimicrobiaceae bacterium]